MSRNKEGKAQALQKISVYVADTEALRDDAVFAAAYSKVSATRRRKIDSFVFRKDRMLSLAAGLLLQKGLADRGVTSYEIGYGEQGKPFLEAWQYGTEGGCFGDMRLANRLHFNLSHSETKVMCAVSDLEVGCDVEKIRPIDLDIAKRFFFTTEYETIAAAKTSARRRKLFYRYWTLKESFMKATGLGMALPLDAFRVDFSGESSETTGTDVVSVVHAVDENRYFFREYDWNDGYRYAVCGLSDRFGEAEVVDLNRWR